MKMKPDEGSEGKDKTKRSSSIRTKEYQQGGEFAIAGEFAEESSEGCIINGCCCSLR